MTVCVVGTESTKGRGLMRARCRNQSTYCTALHSPVGCILFLRGACSVVLSCDYFGGVVNDESGFIPGLHAIQVQRKTPRATMLTEKEAAEPCRLWPFFLVLFFAHRQISSHERAVPSVRCPYRVLFVSNYRCAVSW